MEVRVFFVQMPVITSPYNVLKVASPSMKSSLKCPSSNSPFVNVNLPSPFLLSSTKSPTL